MSSQIVLSHWEPPYKWLPNSTNGDDDDKHPHPGTSTSLPAILAALLPSLVTAIVFILVFVVIRKPFRRIYSPRTYIDLIPEKDRTPSPSRSHLDWIRALVKLDDRFVLEHSSLDGYLFLRFFRTIIFICFVGSCISWPILFPVNATGGGNASQLDKFNLSNVRDPSRLWAHAVVAWLVYAFVMYVVARERLWLIGLRQAWHLSRANAARLSSRTVLYLNPPEDAPLDGDLRLNYGQEARRQWVVTATGALDRLVDDRDSKAGDLESAQVSFLKKASKKWYKLAKKQGDNVTLPEQTVADLRPVHKDLYIVGRSNDAINRLRDELKKADKKVNDRRTSYSTDSSRGRYAVFVEYESQPAAQRAYRANPKILIPVSRNISIPKKLIGILPSEILWSNLEMPHAIRISRKTAGNVFIATLIFFWSVLSAFVGSVSNVHYLSDNFEWLHWIQDLPDTVLGLLTGLLPPLITSLLAAYVPIFMRHVAKNSGEPTTVSAELQVQTWYFLFQVIQVFLVTALSSSATAFIPEILANPDQIPLILAKNLPKSANFYLTYFILQGLASSTKNMLNYKDFAVYYLEKLFNTTPRKKYEHFTSLKGISWGKLYPKFTNFIIIGLAYSCISPLVLGVASVGLSLFYISYRYNLFFVMKPQMETNGRCYTRALSQIFIGLYIGELALIGLMGLQKATGPSILVTILFLGTLIYNNILNRFLNPLEDRLPEKLLAEDYDEEDPLLSAEEGEARLQEAHERSRLHNFGQDIHIPHKILDPIARFFEPHIYASHGVMKRYLRGADPEPPSYSKEEFDTAYANPLLTSKINKIWLPRDQAGLSKQEVEANLKEGIETTDEGAWIDKRGHVKIDEDNLRNMPIWKKPVQY